MGQVTSENLERVFESQPPNADTVPKYDSINAAARAFAEQILVHAPPSADRSEALRCVRLARMWANASIAIKGEI
jgi:hypothetical protein